MIRIISARHNCLKRNSISQHQTSRTWILWKGEVLWQRPHWEQQGLSWRRSEDWHKLSHNPWSAGSSTWESRRWTCEELLWIRHGQHTFQWAFELSVAWPLPPLPTGGRTPSSPTALQLWKTFGLSTAKISLNCPQQHNFNIHFPLLPSATLVPRV